MDGTTPTNGRTVPTYDETEQNLISDVVKHQAAKPGFPLPGSDDPFTTSRAAAQTLADTIMDKDIPKEIKPLAWISAGGAVGQAVTVCVRARGDTGGVSVCVCVYARDANASQPTTSKPLPVVA